MARPRFQFRLKALLLAVALLALPMALLRPDVDDDYAIIDLFGPVQVGQDGSIEVNGGSVRISQGKVRTEIRADRIVVRKDGTAEVDGYGTLVQTAR